MVNRKILIAEAANFDISRKDAVSAMDEARQFGEALRVYNGFGVTYDKVNGYDLHIL